MFLEDHKPLLAIGAFVAFLIIAVAIVSGFWPQYEERFIELGLLGKDKKAKGYYPDGNSTLEEGYRMAWYIYVHNHMDDAQNVSVRAKLLNSTMPVPDDWEHKPSPAPHFFEIPLSLRKDETLIVPFSWSFEKLLENGSIGISRLTVNNQTVTVDVSSHSDNRFRMVLELWVYDPSSNQYKFEWDSGRALSSASLYMWFEVLAKMHVGNISMPYVKYGDWYNINFTVTILDENGAPVPEATVHLNVSSPDGFVKIFTGGTDSKGTVQFSLSTLTVAYTAEVTDVVKEGWIYDPESNIETSETLIIP